MSRQRYAVRIIREDATFLKGSSEVKFEHEAERFASPEAALDAGFLYVVRTPGVTYDVIDTEDRK